MNTQLIQAQPGVLSDPNTFAEYLTFTLHHNFSKDAFKIIIESIAGITKSSHQKDPQSQLTVTTGFSLNGWQQLLPENEIPDALVEFKTMQEDNRVFPSTGGDIFCMIKSERMDLNFQVAKHLKQSLIEIALLVEDIQGFKYLVNRDMIDFVDGTENPIEKERMQAVLIDDEQSIYQGGSYLTVQRYVDRQSSWDAQTTEYQEQVVGRTKMDNIELDDNTKPAWAHTAKSKVEQEGNEIAMYRQNRPFGNAIEHGTMFIGFANTPEVLITSLEQMIFADDNGHYDRLLDFVEAKTGNHYFIPPQTFLDEWID